jgi:hypothetical protein
VQQVQLAKRRRSCGARGYKRKFNVSLVFLSFDQSYYLAPLYSIKRMYNVAPIEHGKQTFHRSLRVPAVFPQDAPGVLNSANDGILVGIVHDGTPTPRNQDSRWGENFRSRLALRFYVSEANAAVARSVLQPRRTH